jgi:hypothetical protein
MALGYCRHDAGSVYTSQPMRPAGSNGQSTNFPRSPLPVGHSPPRRSYLGLRCQLLIGTAHSMYAVVAKCPKILTSRGCIHTSPPMLAGRKGPGYSYCPPFTGPRRRLFAPNPRQKQSRHSFQRATVAPKPNKIKAPNRIANVRAISMLWALNVSRAEMSTLRAEKWGKCGA